MVRPTPIDSPLTCPRCRSATTFDSVGQLATHVRLTHGTNFIIPRNLLHHLSKCNHCGLSFSKGAAFTNHQRACTGTRSSDPRRCLSPTVSVNSDPTSSGNSSPLPNSSASPQPPSPASSSEAPSIRSDITPPTLSVLPCKGVFHVPKSILLPLRSVSSSLIERMVILTDGHDAIPDSLVTIFLNLPCLLQRKSDSWGPTKTLFERLAILPTDDLVQELDTVIPRQPPSTPSKESSSAFPSRRITQLVQANCLSKATRLAESASTTAGLAPQDDTTARSLHNLFPPARTATFFNGFSGPLHTLSSKSTS